MVAWPDILPDKEGGYSRRRRAFQAIEVARDGGVQISAPHPLTQREYPYRWTFLTAAEREQLDNAFISLRSAEFYLFDAMPRVNGSLFLGTGTGSNSTFTVPGKELVGAGIYVAGALKAPDDYTVSEGTGPDGEVQIIFPASQIPTSGQTVYANGGTLRQRVSVYIINGEIEDGLNEADIYTAQVTFLEKIA